MTKPEDQSSNYLSRREAARYLRVSTTALARWASSKRGPAYYRLGRDARYRTEDLDAFLSSKRRPG
jgi:excisionase family DNA binding protein